MEHKKEGYEKLQQALEKEQRRHKEERRLRRQAERWACKERRLREESDQRGREEWRLRKTERRLRKEAERRSKQERRLREKAEGDTLLTTLDEYLNLCHNPLYTSLAVPQDTDTDTDTDTAPTTKSTAKSTTKQSGKLCPAKLLPWDSFLDQQQTAFGQLHDAFPADHRAFDNRNYLRTISSKMAAYAVVSEKALERFQHLSIEDPVSAIIRHAARHTGLRDKMDLGDGITFQNHPEALRESSDDAPVAESQAEPPQTPPPAQAATTLNKCKLRADQICVYRSNDARNRIAFVIEYKAPHMLTLPLLRAGVRDMDIYQEVVHCTTIPIKDRDPRAHFEYHAKQLCAAAVTQTYHYMIEAGLEYGLLSTGEGIVFLKIDWSDPSALYYHLAEPAAEVPAHPDSLGAYTAVGQMAAFALLALTDPQDHPQGERDRARAQLQTWEVDYHVLLSKMPESARKPSPAATGEPARKEKKNKCPPDAPPAPYCSQKCLLGLVRGGKLDHQCPNIALHQAAAGDDSDGIHHPVRHDQWLQLLAQQLKHTLDAGVVRLDLVGSSGVLFQVSLLSHGYTMVAKAAVSGRVPTLQHEETMYGRLEPLQGVSIPVCLGAVSLASLGRTDYYCPGVRLVHMLFLSWAGLDLDDAPASAWEKGGGQAKAIQRSISAMTALGVVHGDVREANMLWCEETGRVMMIDLERAKVVDKIPAVPGRQLGLGRYRVVRG